jgi:uncharacterized protein YigE (DUF2233 family)
MNVWPGRKRKIIGLGLGLLLAAGIIAFISTKPDEAGAAFVTYTCDPKTQDLQLYWQNERGELLNNLGNLKAYVESKKRKLVFATNGGMFKRDFSPQGLLVQHQKTIAPLDTTSGNGNFYLQPNGVFCITKDNTAKVYQTVDFEGNGDIKFATQSGPMLVIDGQIHPAFRAGSSNLHIRNGVGILPNQKVIFVMSKKEINFYDFAKYFQNLGCKNALFLDGFVSRTYLPEKKWIQTDGALGVMIGVTEQTEEK